MVPDVIQVKTLPDYCLEAIFENGERRFFDMKLLLSYPETNNGVRSLIYDVMPII